MKKPITITLILVILGVAGFSIWKYIIQSDNTKTPQPTNSTSTSQSTDTWFEIPEWGVKFKLEKPDANDLGYEIIDGAARFSSKTLSALDDYCSTRGTGIALALTRTNRKVEQQDVVGSMTPSFKNINGYWYNFSIGGAGCTVETEEHTVGRTTVRNAISNSLTAL